MSDLFSMQNATIRAPRDKFPGNAANTAFREG